MNLPVFLGTIQIVYILAAMSPGPNNLLVTRNALVVSRRAGVYTALGIAGGSLLHSTLGLAGISAIIAGSPNLFHVLKWLGSAYLVYLGIRMLLLHHKQSNIRDTGIVNKSGRMAFQRGLLTNMSNPKSYIFYFALFSNMFTVTTPVYLKGIVGLQIFISSVLWHCSLALVFSTPRIQTFFSRMMGILEKVFGVVLVLLGIRIAFSKM